MHSALFLEAKDKLEPADAVAAVLVLEDGRYVMQLRDAIAGIFYPDHWGCFGGAVNPAEQPMAALRRELIEELELDVTSVSFFTRFDFDFSCHGYGNVYRIYYEVLISSEALAKVVLREGADVHAFHAPDILTKNRVTPYDAFAIWLHYKRTKLI